MAQLEREFVMHAERYQQQLHSAVEQCHEQHDRALQRRTEVLLYSLTHPPATYVPQTQPGGTMHHSVRQPVAPATAPREASVRRTGSGEGEGSLPSTISVASYTPVESMDLSQRPGNAGLVSTAGNQSRVAAWDVKGSSSAHVRPQSRQSVNRSDVRTQQAPQSRQPSADGGTSMRSGVMSGLNGGLDYEGYEESVRSMGNATGTDLGMDTGRARSPGLDAVEPPLHVGGGGNGSM